MLSRPCGGLVLLLTLNEFGIVLFTGAKGVITLPVLIYTRGIVTFDLPGAAVIATVQVVLSLALYGLYRVIFARLTARRAVVLVVFAAVVLVAFVLPLGTVVAAGLAGSWNGPLPSDLDFARLSDALSGEDLASLSVSLRRGRRCQ